MSPRPLPSVRSHRLAAGFLCSFLCLSAWANPPEWPEWRGPGAQGHGKVTGVPLEWSETSNVRWKTPIPGRGHSSPAIGNGQLWVTTALETAAKPEDAARRKKGTSNDQPLNVLESVSLRAVCLDLATGRTIRDVEVIRELEPQWVHELNSYASPSPVLEEGRLYVHFGTFGTACLDTATGEVLWRNREIRLMHENGPGSSPVLWRDLLVFHADGSDAQFIVALDKKTGGIRWKTPRSGKLPDHVQLKKAYGTPVVAPYEGRTQLLSVAADWLYSYDPATGSELWKIPYGIQGFSNVPRPVLGPGMIYLSTSFMRPELLAVKYDGRGAPEIVWRWKRGVPQTPSPILVGSELYFVSDAGGLLTCLDAATGTEVYQERLGGNFSSSPSFAEGRLYFHDRTGVTTVVKPGRKFEVLARNNLDGPHMASAAFADASIFLRTEKSVYRIATPAQP